MLVIPYNISTGRRSISVVAGCPLRQIKITFRDAGPQTGGAHFPANGFFGNIKRIVHSHRSTHVRIAEKCSNRELQMTAIHGIDGLQDN